MFCLTDCLVIGAGAAGLMCAGTLAETNENIRVILIDKNAYPGKKLLITGKGRCNVTNDCGLDTLMRNVVTNPRFMYSAFSSFLPSDTMAFFESHGVPLKTERGNRVFPVSDRSSDIVNALRRYAENPRITYLRGTAKELKIGDGKVIGCMLSDGTEIKSAFVVVATGGKSYPQTGSTGDGYNLAVKLGHTVITPKPSLVPIEAVEQSICAELEGLSLKNTGLILKRNGKNIHEDFGELLFTDTGLSGPLILSASSHCLPNDEIILDLKPALDEKQLDNRILSDFDKYANKNYSNALEDLLPRKLIPVIIALSGISPEKKVNSITKAERATLLSLLKSLKFTVKGFRPIEEAIVTSGGVSVKEINPKTMESKLISGLYFAGEVIDTDAYTGGFNLQIAFSTGRAAAKAISENYGEN